MYKVEQEQCVGCGVCVRFCPHSAISMVNGVAVIDHKCVDCGNCVKICPRNAILPGATVKK